MTLAGGYFQLVVWGIATVVWRIVAEETVISQVALIVILFAGLQTLFNFNPLIKLDGYYMLSDYLEIPNLRAKAMKAVHAWLGARSEPLLVSDQRRSLLVYGGLSLTFSTLLLLFVYVNIYLLATFYFDFTGLVGFVMFSTFTLKRTAAESVTAARSLGARALIRKYRNLGIGAVFLIAIIVIPWELRISADFRILPRQESIVRAETAGTVDEILVTEGDDVAAGDLIARLYDPDKEKELSFVEGELASKRAELAQLRAGPRPEEIDQAETLVETRRTELANVSRNGELRLQLEQTLAREENELLRAEIDLRKATDMFVEEVGPRIDMELAQAAVDAQKNSVGMTEASLRILTEETSRDSDLKQHELAEAESALALLLAGSRAEEIPGAGSRRRHARNPADDPDRGAGQERNPRADLRDHCDAVHRAFAARAPDSGRRALPDRRHGPGERRARRSRKGDGGRFNGQSGPPEGAQLPDRGVHRTGGLHRARRRDRHGHRRPVHLSPLRPSTSTPSDTSWCGPSSETGPGSSRRR